MRSTAVILIFGLSLLGSAGDIGFSPSYAQAQVDYREISPGGAGDPPAGQTDGTPSGQPGAPSGPAPAGATTESTPGITVSGIVSAIADTPTAMGAVADPGKGSK